MVVLANAGGWGLLATPSRALGIGPSVTVKLAPASIVADGSSTSMATATVTGLLGQPAAGETVAFSSSDTHETVGAVTDHGDGTYTATITSSLTPGLATITANDTSVTPNLSGSATLTQTAGPAKTVTVTLSPGSILADGNSTSTANATITDAQGHPLSGQTVGFSSSDTHETVGAVTDHGDGTYTATITSSLTPGPATITATDTSVTPNLSGSATLTQTAGPAKTVTVTLFPGSIVADGNSTSTAAAVVTDAQGHPLSGQTVGFSSSDAGEHIGATVYAGNGTYTATITSSRTAGFATITATDTSVSPPVFGQARLAQAANTSTTTVMALPGAPVTNQGVTLIATVTASSSAATPSGVVTFKAGSAPISGCALVPVATISQSATVTCQTSLSAAASPVQLTAVFTSNRGSIVADSTSATDHLVVSRDATSTAFDVSNPTVKAGSGATYTATVTPSHAGPVQPSGAVEFLDRGVPITSCVNQPVVSGTAFAAATCHVTYKKPGEHLITGRYGGDTAFNGSASSPPQPVTVRKFSAGVRGTITSTMHWTFYYTPSYTRVLALIVQHASAGMTVLVNCRGRGCPFAKRATAVTKRCGTGAAGRCSSRASKTVNLVRRFREHRLHPGSQLNVELSRPGLIGKSFLFRFRAGHPPRIQIRCLAPGGTRPGVGC
ncbi:MAG: invasin domain 3-containing protein [Solirubrobacteraceae bacterium]